MATRCKFEWGNFLSGGLLLYIMATITLYAPIQNIIIAIHELNWQPAQAIVIQGATSNRAVLIYEYEVNGQFYQSQRYGFAVRRAKRLEAIRDYEEGQIINIYYDPNQPKEAIVVKREFSPLLALFRGLIGSAFVWMATGLTFFGDVGGLAYRSWEKAREKEQKHQSRNGN